MSKYKVYSYQTLIVQAMTGGSIGQGVGSDVLYKKVTPPHYSYQSFFGTVSTFYNLKNIYGIITQNNAEYWTKHRRANRDYLYPNYFGGEAWYYQLSNVPFILTQSSNKTEYWLLNRRKNKDYMYPSLFMNVKLLGTPAWSCDTVSSDDEWTCT